MSYLKNFEGLDCSIIFTGPFSQKTDDKHSIDMHQPPVLKLGETEHDTVCLEIAEKFKLCYDKLPDFFVRVPGRVNIIGEHIDYCGYPVLPMAIEHDIIIAVNCRNDGLINIRNFESEKYPDFSSSAELYKYSLPSTDALKIQSAPNWYNYILCGFKGIWEKFFLTVKGFDMLVKGSIPPSSGLSSSSALVCAGALVVSFANRLPINKADLASLCAKAERYIGTEGGGMDQAIGFLAEPGKAKFVEFNPLRATDVPIPEDVVFVVCNSCVSMNKAATSQFNTRVVECKLATKVLSKIKGLEWEKYNCLSEIPCNISQDAAKLADEVKKLISEEVFHRSALCEFFSMSENEFETKMLSGNTEHLQEFKLADRAIHVFEEASRVRAFKTECEKEKVDIDLLGKLMNESHQSCRDLYECSHPILDELVSIARAAGAIGSRLTGAGWGGCCISLVRKDAVNNFLRIVEKSFYSVKGLDASTSVFITKPSGGAAVILFNETV